MSSESEILADFRQLLAEHGVSARWKTTDLLALVSRVRREQQIDMGGFVESPELSLRVAKEDFPGVLPKFGERIEVDGLTYRIMRVSDHPRSPLLILTLGTTDE
jgi:hypothetical protein